MSDYHVRGSDDAGNAVTVVCHVPVPDTTNKVGVNYRAAIVEYQGGAPIGSVMGDLGAEQTALDAGEIVETVESHSGNPGLTDVQLRDRLDARFGELADAQGVFVKMWQRRLQWWGYSRDVP